MELYGYIWIKDLVKEKAMEKLDDLIIRDHWIIYLFHFYFISLTKSLIQTQPEDLV